MRELLRDEAETPLATDDGHRAWVLRDALTAPASTAVRGRACEPGSRASGAGPAAGNERAAPWPRRGFRTLTDRPATRRVAEQGERYGEGRAMTDRTRGASVPIRIEDELRSAATSTTR